jgi:predicted dehydrogenase
MMKTVCWGIIGTGSVADQFCSQLSKVKEARIARILSSSEEKAYVFANKYSCAKAGNRIEDLVGDEELDVVYIASSTRLHEEHAMLCLENGLGVVCEKPFVTSVAAFDRIMAKAREKKVFCMEGMWMRFNPLVRKAKELTMLGKIGEIKSIHASLGYKVSNLEARLLDSQRGALWDFGVYGISLLEYFLGQPKKVLAIHAQGSPARGVASVFEYDKALASVTLSIEAELDNEATICGTEGTLTLGAPFFAPTQLRASCPLFRGNAITDRIQLALEGFLSKPISHTRHRMVEKNPLSGFDWQALEVTQAILAGKQELDLLPLAATRAVIKIAEEINDGIESKQKL